MYEIGKSFISKILSSSKYFCILMLAPFRQKKTANLHWISYRGEPFLIIDNCRYGTKLTLNSNADLMPI